MFLVNKSEKFKSLFNVEFAEVSQEIKDLWVHYDVYTDMIDDGTQWRKAIAYNDWLVSEIKEKLKS